MADKKISQLTALSAANVASATDVLAIVDTSATETKKITAKDLIDGALNGGTANGVLYLNGSKVATSGSALVFDGTNLGIGTASPGAKLGLGGSADISMKNTANTSGFDIGLLGGSADAIAYIYQRANAAMLFATNNTERARITAGGYFKAKANNANYLDVSAGNYEFAGDTANAYIFKVSNGGNNSNRFGAAIQCGANDASGTNYALVFDDGDGTRQGEITFSGGTTTYGTSSDYRLKENIRPINNAIARLAQLKPCKWEWKRNGLESEGFVAHELQEVVPIAVAGEKDEVDANGNPMYQSVGAANIVPLLTAALQEAMARIEQLEADMAALKASA